MAGVDTRITLSAIQCIELGIHAISKDYYYQAINWMEAAVSKIASENDTTASLTEAEIQLETVKKVVSLILQTLNLIQSRNLAAKS